MDAVPKSLNEKGSSVMDNSDISFFCSISIL